MIAESVARLAASLLAVARTRLELAATEVEEETLRYFSYLILSLAALFCLGIAIVLGTILLVVLYWDSHRIAVLAALMAIFGIIGLAIGLHVRVKFLFRSRPLAHTLAELSRDSEMLQPPA
jgi:uncharacterized membrane protein YqjE